MVLIGTGRTVEVIRTPQDEQNRPSERNGREAKTDHLDLPESRVTVEEVPTGSNIH